MKILPRLFRHMGACFSALAFVGAGLSASAAEYEVPIGYHTLDNGLKVVLSEDDTVPTTTNSDA